MFSIGRSVVVLLAVLAPVGSLAAQDQLITKEQDEQFAKVAFQFREKAMPGGLAATPGAADLELASRYFVLRVTYLQAQLDPVVMGKILNDFEIMAANAASHYKQNRDIVGKFSPHLVNRFKEVFALNFGPNRVAIVNAAVLLPQLARFRDDKIGDYLGSVVADDKLNNLIRMHAARGLREFFPTRPFTKLELNQGEATKQALERKKKDVERVNALLKFIDHIDVAMKQAKNAEEVDALRYMRTQAVATLALAGAPAVSSLGDAVEGPVALGLVKVLAKKVQPEPSIRERAEAARGICYFTKYVEEYDPKIGVYLVGNCLSEFFAEYKKDYANISLKTRDKERKPTYLPWKHESKLFEAALAELVNNTRGTASANAAQTIESMAKPMLAAISSNQPIDREVAFNDAIEKLKPNTKVLFKTKGKPLEYDWQSGAAAEEK
jgi:hypothetical protein